MAEGYSSSVGQMNIAPIGNTDTSLILVTAQQGPAKFVAGGNPYLELNSGGMCNFIIIDYFEIRENNGRVRYLMSPQQITFNPSNNYVPSHYKLMFYSFESSDATVNPFIAEIRFSCIFYPPSLIQIEFNNYVVNSAVIKYRTYRYNY